MRCPSCGCEESKVVDSRSAEEGTSIRRRRECLECNQRFTTYERTSEYSLIVIKSDGSKEMFDQEKLMHGLMVACTKRPVTPDQILDIINSIEKELIMSNRREVKSKELGNMALSRLANLDDVAYIRFASVYKDFKSVDEFSKALTDMKDGA